MPTYVLPDLDYDYGALEPHISAQIMQLHHDKHHATYVKKANETLEKLEEARAKADYTRIAGLEKSLAFNISGHTLHSVFWKNLVPKGGGRPGGSIADAITKDFGSFELFQKQMNEVAGSIMGSGWGALVYEPIAGRLLISQVYDHQSNVAQGGMPLMVLDAWEHAYYLQYKTDKAKFFEASWNLWNWDDVSARYDAARAVNLLIPEAAQKA
jgi:Fe-Mn family superoxide dismutase